MEVAEVLLPGVGVRYEFTAASGDDVGIVARRDGEFDVVCFRRSDPDAAETLFTLDRQQAEALADILGAPRIVERFADLSREIPGLASATIDIPGGSLFDGRTLGETRLRTLTGVSIVAVVKDDLVVPSPTPDEVLLGGHSLVVIGTEQGIESARGVLLG
ncbi:cation:proton antiporter regulatory subunit [Nocardioides sp.]|uniref:cation:proton antiporter regulatory subunit n=1 Tax=Nocardioides sp. TaxID=35761 RepID=UPI0027330C2B|nr:cation:proton antiporter regulatory subunit [Nocardioides sp.]MDP3894996.1 cation:proton antiporter regulatory subunit [Nocardioides sp.]